MARPNLWVFAVEALSEERWVTIKTFFCGEGEGRVYQGDEGQTRIIKPLQSVEEVEAETKALRQEWIGRGVPERDIRISKSQFSSRRDINADE